MCVSILLGVWLQALAPGAFVHVLPGERGEGGSGAGKDRKTYTFVQKRALKHLLFQLFCPKAKAGDPKVRTVSSKAFLYCA